MGDDLLKSLAAGEPAAYQSVYDQYGVALYRSALRLLGSRHDAEDAVQEVFVGVARSRKRMTDVHNLRAYLFTSLRHCVSRVHESRARQAGLKQQLQWIRPTCSPLPGDPGGILWQTAEQLPAEQFEVVVLKLQGGLTFKEIGQVCGITQDTAASRYRYAIEKLRKILETP